MPPRILLYATMNWPSAARYAGGFVAAGCKVDVLCPEGGLATLSRYVARSHRYRPLLPLFSLRAVAAKSTPDLLVACDDRAVAHLVRLYFSERRRNAASPLAALIARSLGAPENYARVISRYGSLSELAARGVRVPGTQPVKDRQALDTALEKIGLPAVLKVDGSWGGDGVVIARTRAEAHAAFRKLSRPAPRLRSLVRAWRRRDAHFLLPALNPERGVVSVQRFVAGHAAASAFAAHKGKVVASFHYDVLVADGTIGPPNVIRRVDDPEMDRVVRETARCFGLSGLFGLDYIRDEAGAAHLIEINPRATQGGTLPFGEGRDLPSSLVAALTGRTSGRRAALTNDVVVFFPREMRRDPESPYLKTGYHDIPDDDPAVLNAMLGAGVLGPRASSPLSVQTETTVRAGRPRSQQQAAMQSI